MSADFQHFKCLLQELEEESENLNIKDLLKEINVMKETLMNILTEYHEEYAPVSTEIANFSREFRLVTQQFKLLNDEINNSILPSLKSASVVSTDVRSQPVRLSISELHSASVEKLEKILPLLASCKFLLQVHESLESLGALIDSLVNVVNRKNNVRGTTEEYYKEAVGDQIKIFETDHEAFDFGAIQPSFDQDLDGDWQNELKLVVTALERVQQLFEENTFFKSELRLFQVFKRTFSSQTVFLYEFFRSQWSQLVKIEQLVKSDTTPEATSLASQVSSLFREFSPSRANSPQPAETLNEETPSTIATSSQQKELVIARLIVTGSHSQLEALLQLLAALKKTRMHVEAFSREIWETFFVPWLKAQTSPTNETVLALRSSAVQNPSLDRRSPFWQLELVHSMADESEAFVGLVVESCDQLSSALEGLGSSLFSLTVPEPASSQHSSRLLTLVDFCRDQGLFDTPLVSGLLSGHLMRSLASAGSLSTAAADAVATFDLDRLSAFPHISRAVRRLIDTGIQQGFFSPADQPINAVLAGPTGAALLWGYLDRLVSLSVERQQSTYLKAVHGLLSESQNFASTRLVASSQEPDRVPHLQEPQARSEAEEDEAEEELLEGFELLKRLEITQLVFPPCQVSLACLKLLEQVEGIISDAQTALDNDLGTTTRLEVEEKEARGTGPRSHEFVSFTAVRALIELVPRLIFLYPHIVTTLHCSALKTDLKLMATFHNDCMYLAHDCLSLGKRALYPLAERLQALGPSSDSDSMMRRLASVSTCHLVSQLRSAGTSALLEGLRQQRNQLRACLSPARRFKSAGGENAETCQQALLDCLSHLLRAAHSLGVLPVTIFLRAIGALSEEIISEFCTALFSLEDITTVDCMALISIITSLIRSISSIFEEHLEAASEHRNYVLMPSEESLAQLLARRIPSWLQLQDTLTVLSASSLEEIRSIWTNRSSHYALSADSLKHLIKALYRDSSHRTQTLRHISE